MSKSKTTRIADYVRASANRAQAPIKSVLGLFADSVEIAAADKPDDLPKISMLAYTGAAIKQPWSWDYVVINLDGIELPAKAEDVPIFCDHDVDKGVGHATKLFMSPEGLRLEGLASRATPHRAEVIQSSKNGFKWKASIGAGDLVVQYYDKGETLIANGREFPGPVTYVVRCKLKEVSFVSMAADPSTEAIAASDQEREEVMSILRTLSGTKIQASGETPKTETPNTAGDPAVVAAATATSKKVEDKPIDPVTTIRAAHASEVERIEACRKVCEGQPEILAKAIREGWTSEKAELETLRASRPNINVLVPSGVAMNGDVLAAAVCQTCGLKDVEKGFDAKTLEAADKQFRGSIGLNQLLHIAASQSGYSGDHYFRNSTSLRGAIRAAFSSNTLSSVLSSVANKFVLEGFYSEERVWERIAKVNPSVQNFKEYETYAKVSQLKMSRLAPDGKIKHGAVGDEKFDNQLDTFAIMLGIPRKAFIDDDIGILSSLALDFGVGAAETLNDVFWTEFQDDAAFFTTALGNLTSGAGGAMAEASLKAAFTKFRTYTKTVNGIATPIGMPAKFILTGPTLEWTVNEWMKGTVRVTGSTTPVVAANLLAGQAEPLVSRYITSTTAWYLLADPVRRPTMEVGFLRGKTRPTVEEVEPDADMLGVAMRAYWDFGARKQVPQGGLKVAGA